jgi:hypothetical protein
VEVNMNQTSPRQEAITRDEAVALVRGELLKITDDDNSICKVASERDIFCHGFQRNSDGGLRRCYAWLDKRRPGMTRPELEDLANTWQLARQEVDQLPFACDVQQKEHDSCGGWDDFSNEDLSRFYSELTGHGLLVA